MLQGEHSAILSTFIKLPFAIKSFVLSIFEWTAYDRFYCIIKIMKVCHYFSIKKHVYIERIDY